MKRIVLKCPQCGWEQTIDLKFYNNSQIMTSDEFRCYRCISGPYRRTQMEVKETVEE